MGIAKTTLEYVSLTTGNWVKAVTPDGNDAVVMLNVEQSINTAAKADIILSNRSPNPTSTVASEAKGLLTDVFSDFQRIRLIHQEKGIPIFSGRIYDIRDKYDLQYGQTIRLAAFDSYKELLQFPIDDAADTLEEIDTTDSDEGGYDLRKRSQVIKYMLDEVDLKDKNLLTTDVNQFEDSWSTDSLGDKKLNLTKIDRNVGGVLFDLAVGDPVKTQGGTHIGESGYDYRVEPRWVSSALTSKPIESLHYFMRGTRPGKGGAYGASAAPVLTTTSTDSLTVEYAGSTPDSGLKQTMMSMFEFDYPKEQLQTSVVLHYTDEGKEDESNDDESPTKIEGVVTFELLKGSAMTGTFTWALKALDVNKPGVVNVPELLNIQGGATGVARVQWQNSDGNLLLISDINETTFPTTGTTVLVGATSNATFTFNAATGRMQTKYGVERPVRIQRNLTSDLGMLRDEVVSRLVGQLDLKITRGKFQTVEYPIVYHDLPSNSSRSSNTITWSGTVAAQTRGVRIGHVIAEINSSGEYVRYAYISAVTNNTSITYGASATDTSDGTALNSTNTIRLVIPLRPGDVIKVKNATSGIDTDQVILSLGYDESSGMFATRYETVGSNNKFSNIYSEADAIRAAVAAATPKKFPPAKPLGELSVNFQGNINRGSNPSDSNNYRRIHWTTPAGATSGAAGKLILGDGTKYTIACANSAILTADPHYLFFRPTKARASANRSDTTFQVVLKTSYTQDPDDVMIGWCHAVDDKIGAQAVLYITASGFDSKNLFAAGQNGTLTEALLSKSAQEYNSPLEITPIADDHTNYAAAGHRHVVWAAAAIKFGDGDTWNIVAGGNDLSSPYYSVTTNGTSYSNIDILAENSTYYVYIDTSEANSGGSLNLRFTTNYSHISTHTDGTFSSAKVLVAQIVTPATNAAGYKVPRILGFGNKSLVINAAAIGADAITATHITASAIQADHIMANGLPGSVLNIDSSTTFATGYDPTQIDSGNDTSVGGSAPGSPSTGDVWVDTGSTNDFKRWSGSAWVTYDLGTSKAIGQAAQVDADTGIANAATAAASAAGKRIIFTTASGSVPTALASGDLWIQSDTDKMLTASSPGTGSWHLRDDAGAINNATTNVNGGRIVTQTIVLKAGGAGNPNNANGILMTNDTIPTNTNPRIILNNTGIVGYDSSGNFQFKIQATDGKGIFGAGAVTLDSSGMHIVNGGYVRSGTKTYGASAAGFFLGYSGGAYKFDIGTNLNYLRWDGSGLSIKGTIILSDGTAEAAIKNANTVGSDLGGGYGDSTIGGLTLAANKIYIGSGNYFNSDTAFYVDNTGDFSLKNKLKWDQSANTLEITGKIIANDGTIGGWNINNYDITSTNGLLEFGRYGTIKGWKTSQSDSNLKYQLSTGTTAFTVYGSTKDDPALKIQTAYGSSTYGYIHGDSTGGTSDVTYQARYHRFQNFADSGYVRDIYSLTMKPVSATVDVRLATLNNFEDLHLVTEGSYSQIRLYVDDTEYLEIDSVGSIKQWEFAGSTNLIPVINNNGFIGTSSRRWSTFYSVNDLDFSSDANEKEHMITLTDGLDIIDRLNPIKYNRIGETTTRFGFTSQALKEVMINTGYGTDVAVYSEQYNMDTGGTSWGIAPTQLIAHLVSSIKELKQRIEILEGA